VKISSIFSSDLQRAFKTAEAIRLAQPVPLTETIRSKLLRERDFGSYEGKTFAERSRDGEPDAVRSGPGFKEVESRESLILRMNSFIDSHLAELLTEGADEDCIAVVSHGIALNYLWRTFLKRFRPQNVVLAWGLTAAEPHGVLKNMGGWSNTGYMDLEIQKKPILPKDDVPSSELESSGQDGPDSKPKVVTERTGVSALNAVMAVPSKAPADAHLVLPQRSFASLHLTVRGTNCRDHLRELKKTRGGLGSIEHDARQTSLDSFVKRRKV
jgi:hypothetical protein